ncbi:beta galactosidase jelly roll domain-containing protein [Bacillus sp. FJAT-49732]|uniref:Beta galactosidase jelly roll domain-containing protein n=2 Tax=Lederbergia citrisecunda TaxID=2833583 RepID=A0A942TQZ6_9BACI|nr:sugar-binding domain-containing protein [Lederbergia citrisecunda]MBS4200497.1 beta galactosidase jelly roll domain-containing protein [Lederbergia citrisecunda]
MVRADWMNLNGNWEFELDHGKSGKQRNWFEEGYHLSQNIVVPFCPESELSGIGYTDFMAAVWYKRQFTIPDHWQDNRVLVHFGAVDYDAEVWINGQSVGKHRGGYSSFSFDITEYISPGDNVVTVCAEDDVRSGLQPRGKQSGLYYSHGCDYTRTTGIWQTVWLECVPKTYISKLKYYPDPDNHCVHIEAELNGDYNDQLSLAVSSSFNGKAVGHNQAAVSGRKARLSVELSEIYLWEPGNPNLYDLEIQILNDGKKLDSVESYFGLRSIKLDGMAFKINDKSIFQRLVLDQGFYPDGIYTAPSDEALRKDIELSMEMGFNGARLHEKVFEPRFLYWADKLGYLVWGEHANWGLDITTATGIERFLPEWLEVVERDFNHPALIGWCPFNETWDLDGKKQNNEVLRIVYNVTKQVDPTRPVIDTSGNFHVETDIYDVHDYDQNPETFAARYEAMKQGGEIFTTFSERQQYGGQPYFVSEFGGIWWNPDQKDDIGWGYGDRPKSEEEFLSRYEGLVSVLLDNPYMFGFCYTQLYDIEQEVNGLYTYDRKPKFDPDIIRNINSRKAAIE